MAGPVLLQTSGHHEKEHPHMARLMGVDLPRDKRAEVALTYIFGVGKTSAQKALAATGVSPDTRVKDLGDDELVKLRDWIEDNLKVEGNLRREVAIVLLNEEAQPVYRYLVHRAWVSEFQALPDLDAGSNAVAIEHIRLENEGWERDTSLTEPLEK